jgi:hypothetical protein
MPMNFEKKVGSNYYFGHSFTNHQNAGETKSVKNRQISPYSGTAFAVIMLIIITLISVFLSLKFPQKPQVIVVNDEKKFAPESQYSFENRRAVVKSKEGDKYGYVDERYDLVIPMKYDMAHPFQNGRALVSKNIHMGIINPEGEEIIPCAYRAIRAFKEGFYAAYLSGKGWGYLNWEGDVIISHQYRDAYPFSEGLAAVENQQRFWGFIDSQGKVQINFLYESVKDFKGGLAAVKSNDLWGFINKNGQWIIKPQYNQVVENNFDKGNAKVRKNGKTLIIDASGFLIN